MREVFTINDVAERWECSSRHVRNMVETGQLPAFRVGKLIRIRRAVVEAIEPQILGEPPRTEESGLEPREEAADSPKPHRAWFDVFQLPPGLPPRGLDREQAAAYVGLPPTNFDAQVKAGVLPQSLPFGRRRVGDVRAIDKALDLLSGITARDPNQDRNKK